MKKLVLFVLLMIPIFITSCDDILPPVITETDNQVYDLSPEIKELVTDEQLARLQKAGFPIHEGTTPPHLDTTVYADKEECIFSDDGDTDWKLPAFCYLNFSNFNQEKNSVIYNYSMEDFTNIIKDKEALLSGADNKFTAFMKIESKCETVDYEIEYSNLFLVSGRYDPISKDIESLYIAHLLLDKKGDEYDHLMAVDAIRVFRETDVVAKYASWTF